MTEQPHSGSAEQAAIRVFLNYRSADTGGHALHLYTDLAERFGSQSVFHGHAGARARSRLSVCAWMQVRAAGLSSMSRQR
jgi:hypothetical protein